MSWLDATYRDSFVTCAAVPCTRPHDRVTVPAGNRIAGTMAKSGFASLAWRAADAHRSGAGVALARRDAGQRPQHATSPPAPHSSALRASHDIAIGPGTLSLLARLDNIGNVAYAGAVIVNEANGRYFETAAGRNALLALRWRMPF